MFELQLRVIPRDRWRQRLFKLHSRDLSTEHWRVCVCELCSRFIFGQLECITIIYMHIMSGGLLFRVGCQCVQQLRPRLVSAKRCSIGLLELHIGLLFRVSRHFMHELRVGHLPAELNFVELFELRRR